MKRPQTAITLYSSEFDNGARDIIVPVGECDYWVRRLHQLAGVSLIGLPADKPNLPYLGYVALPDDRLAREWLIDQHAEATNG